MDLHLKDKVVLITGGSRGIGRAIAEEFLAEGAKVFIAAHEPQEVETALQELGKLGSVAGCVTDVSDISQIKEMVEKAMADFGKIDVLVNNAGILLMKNVLEMTPEEWDKIFSVNARGYMFCAQEVAKVMQQKGQGAIVNIASIAGMMGMATLEAYCATKAGIISLTKSLALSLAPNIRVNAIGPGLIETAMTKDILANEQQKQYFLSKIPLKRAGQPVDIAKVAVFLASDAASFMTGTTVFVDGGWLAG